MRIAPIFTRCWKSGSGNSGRATDGEAAMTGLSGVVPAHVPAGLVQHYDFRQAPQLRTDPWGWMERLNDEPEIFWSTDLGGSWVITSGRYIEELFARGDLFSVRSVAIPKQPDAPVLIPNNLE